MYEVFCSINHPPAKWLLFKGDYVCHIPKYPSFMISFQTLVVTTHPTQECHKVVLRDDWANIDIRVGN